MDRSVWNVLKCLVTSRKVWVAAIGVAGAVVLYLQDVIDAEKLASAFVALATAVILAIAAEDSAEKLGAGKHESAADEWPVCIECGAPATHVAEGPVWYCKTHAPWDALEIVVSEI